MQSFCSGGHIYKAVFFDAFDTIVSVPWSKHPAKRGLPAPHSVSTLVRRIDGRLQAAYGRARSNELAEGDWLAHAFASLVDLTGLAHSGPLNLLRRRESAVRRWFAVYADALSTLQTLHRICRLGIISNAWPYLEPLINLLGIAHYFESVTISSQVGLSKPNLGIYQLAVRTFHIDAHEAVFVDDVADNVAAAERAGLRALWLVRAPSGRHVPARHHDLAQIQSLEQVIPLLRDA